MPKMVLSRPLVNIFPRLFGTPMNLEFILPKLCCNCGLPEPPQSIQVHLDANRFGMRVAPFQAFAMYIPLCGRCAGAWIEQPVTVNYVKRKFISGKAARISLNFSNHEFAQAFENLNRQLIVAGWLHVTASSK